MGSPDARTRGAGIHWRAVSSQDSGSDSLIGQTLDSRYQVEALIGRGGMGDVYLARHLLLGSKVALKVLAGERAGDPNAARRFVREARSAFRVDHPHCVRVIDLGASGSGLYIAMEYLDGRTVGDELRADGPIGSGRAAHMGAQVAAALAHAHGLGLVHRDLKPENVMLVRRAGDPDFVKVLDFGLARVFDERAELAGTAISMAPLTRDGMVFGTPEYMSPEQAAGGPVGPQGDVYALGAVLYHMVTGEPPFSGQTFTEILSRHVREAPVPPGQRWPGRRIAPSLDRLILECLEKPEGARPAGAAAVAARLEAIARELGGDTDRAASATSAADTADLAASGIEWAADGRGADAADGRSAGEPPGGGRAEARSAETVELAPVSRTAEMWGGAAAAPGAPDAAEAPVRPTIRSEIGPRHRRWRVRTVVLACAGAGLGAALALAVVGVRAPRTGSTPTRAAGASPIGGSAAVTPTSAAGPSPIDAHRAAPTATPSGALSPAGPPTANPDPPPEAGGPAAAGAARTSTQVRADKHLRAAEGARRSGNLLRQLAEADQARRLDPQNRRAALLMGEALVKSGDRTNGCPLLRRSARLYRQAGCAN